MAQIIGAHFGSRMSGIMKRYCLLLSLLVLGSITLHAQLPYTVELTQDEDGWQLLVDSEPFPVNGVVWSFTPIGENFNYSLWDQPESIIRRVIDTDAQLMSAMGVNVIRSFSGVPPKWVRYLYNRYGIYTMVNYLFARYGISVDGKWYPNTDYSMEATREKILDEARETVEIYRDTPGVLMFFYGNENNYGLQWESDAIENLPIGQRLETRARFLYSLFEEAIVTAKELTPLPVGIVNGDVQYLNIIAEETPSLDIFGSNIYRGRTSSDLFFESVRKLIDKPIVYTEFGADAFNVRTELEDQYNQALFLRSQWQEIYEQSYGKGKSQNMLGGFIFEWLDEWWKHGLDVELFEHNTIGTWRNAAYYDGGTPVNNMNEEWFGIIGQSEEVKDGVNVRLPRAAYYMMQDIWTESLYDIPTSEIEEYFASRALEPYVVRGEGRAVQNQLGDFVQVNGSVYIGMRGHFSNNNQQGQNIDFSHEEVTSLSITAKPLDTLTVRTTLRAQLEALSAPFFDTYSSQVERPATDPDLFATRDDLLSARRIPIEFYSGAFKFETDVIELQGYYHDGIDNPGHADYYLEGDFFYIYPETFDIVGMDLSLSKAPFGVELKTKGQAEGFNLFIGPEIFWGAQPAAYAKFYRELFDNFYLGVVHYEAFRREQFNSNLTVIPTRFPERKSSLYLQYGLPVGPVDLTFEGGLLIAGTEYLTATDDRIQRSYQDTDGSLKEIQFQDTLGGKIRIETLVDINPVFNIYAEYIYAGLVAKSRPFLPRGGTQIVDSGGSNRHEIIAGGNVWIGDFVISPKFRWRTPLIGAITSGTPRNAISQAAYVDGSNRELIQAEVVLTYDQTGATWFHEWNNADRENALFAASLGFLYTFLQGPTDQLPELFRDATFTGYGLWPTGLSAESNLWSLQARLVSNFAPRSKIIFIFNTGYDQNIGRPDTSPEMRYSGTVDLQLDKLQIGLGLDHNTFGPEDWHFNQNIRVPWQWNFLLAYHLGIFSFIESPTKDRIGIQWRGRAYDGATPESRTALNTLGTAADVWRMEFTLFYELTY